MNRFELLGIALLLAVGVVFVLKSKGFDRFINWMVRGTNPTTVEDIRAEKARVDESKQTLEQHLDKTAAQVKAARKDLKSL